MNRMVMWIASLPAMALSVGAWGADIDWSKVDQAMGKKGSDLPGGVHKYGLPRSDLKVTVDGVTIKPALALGSWLAFQPAGDGAMVMGDLVLTDTEISPVMQRLIEAGVEITAVHNHLLRTSMPVLYMHVGGHGDAVKLAQALHAGLALSHTPLSQPSAPPSPAPLDLDTAALDKALGARGTVNGGVYQFSIPRAESVSEGGMAVPPSMGTATALNFQPTGGGKAAITGDFVLLGSEVNPVVKALRQHGIEVTALHSHMIDDSPHLFFMHFWAHDDAQRLARGLRFALDLANVKRGS
jgi:biotin operon repressor